VTVINIVFFSLCHWNNHIVALAVLFQLFSPASAVVWPRVQMKEKGKKSKKKKKTCIHANIVLIFFVIDFLYEKLTSQMSEGQCISNYFPCC
jgi:hypothetical protein